MTPDDLKELGIVDTGQTYANLKICKHKETNNILLFQLLDGKYEVYDTHKKIFEQIKNGSQKN